MAEFVTKKYGGYQLIRKSPKMTLVVGMKPTGDSFIKCSFMASIFLFPRLLNLYYELEFKSSLERA
jgi:hypothetical protein